MFDGQFSLPPQTLDCPDDRRGPDVTAHVGDIPPVLEPGEVLLGRSAAVLAGDLMGGAPAVRDDLVRQAIGDQAAGQLVCLADINLQIDNGMVGEVLLEVHHQRQGRRLIVGRQRHLDPFAQPAQEPRLLVGNLPQGRETKIAQIAQHQIVRPEMRDNRRCPGLIRRRPIRDMQVMDHQVRVVIDQIDFYGRGARTASRPFKVLSEFGMQATLRAVFEQDPTERRQEGRRELCTHSREILA